MRKKALSKTPMTVWRVLIYLFLFLFMAACLFPLARQPPAKPVE